MSLSLRFSGALDVRWQGEVWGLPERQDTLRLWLALVFREGQAIERAALATELWPALGREQRASRLRYHLHALKRYLPTRPEQEEGWLRVDRKRIAWNPDARMRSDLDMLRSGLRSIDTALSEGALGAWADIEDLRRRAIELVALDKGPLLPAWDEPFLESPRTEMDGLQVDLLDRVAELHRIVGRRDAAVERSKDLLRRRPTDERAHRRLMRMAAAALNRDELQARHELAQASARDLEGRELEDQTSALFTDLQRWLQRVEDAASVKLDDQGPEREHPLESDPLVAKFGPLPDDVISLNDERVDELGRLESLRALHARERCVTLSGAGGSGKTRLLTAVLIGKAEKPALAADLDAMTGSSGLYRGLADLLEIPDGLVVRESAEARALLANTIGQHQLSLVLDHGERHASALAALLPELLRACPGLRLVIASRETLRIAEETVWRMPLLTVPRDRSGRVAHGEAMILLEQERRSLGQRLGLDERAAMARICIALDGLPIALVAAARALESWAPHDLAQRIEEQAEFILDGPLPDPSAKRYASLRASYQAEVRGLGPRERAMLRGLANLESPFTLDQIRDLGELLQPPMSPPAGTTWVETLQMLRERSLIEIEVLPDGDYAYRILSPLRAFMRSLPERFFQETVARDDPA